MFSIAKCVLVTFFLMICSASHAQALYGKAGDLKKGTGTGRADGLVYVPDMRFPLEKTPAYLNSQVYSLGTSWSDPKNYNYPWQDNFCETRSWKTPLCPTGSGHQGQDIRPADKKKDFYWAVAAEAGQIVYVSQPGGWKVQLKGTSTKTLYNYLHLNMKKLAVRQGDIVNAGQRLGLVSNDFGGTPTSVHLHFEIQQAVKGYPGYVHVPPYATLIESYKDLLKSNGLEK